MSSREKVLDTILAVVMHRLGIESPFFKDNRTQDATKSAKSYLMSTAERLGSLATVTQTTTVTHPASAEETSAYPAAAGVTTISGAMSGQEEQE